MIVADKFSSHLLPATQAMHRPQVQAMRTGNASRLSWTFDRLVIHDRRVGYKELRIRSSIALKRE